MLKLIFTYLALVGLTISASAQVPMTGAGLGTPTVTAGYQGPGDVFSTSAYGWYSCARAYNAAYAAAQSAACDVVDTATGVVTCTYHVGTNGFVNPTECNTVGKSCATACSVTKMYDQTGNSRDMIQATLGSMPALTFSSTPTATLPAVSCTNSPVHFLATTGTFTQAQPLFFSAVHDRTALNATPGLIGGAVGAFLGGSTANLALVSGGTSLTATASDNAWHATQGLANGNGTSSAINVDGSDTLGAAGTTGWSATALRLCRAVSTGWIGLVAEAGIWAASTTATDRGNINTNQHGTNGYNF